MVTVADEMLRLGAAALLGAAIGLEREWGDRAAGLRTHALVSTASALMMLVSAYAFEDAVTPAHTVVLDPSRIAAQVVSGVGFLGAGTIIMRKDTVRGLTTAASIWLVAGIGLACGAGMYAAAAGTTGLALLILWGLKKVQRRVFAHKRVSGVTVSLRRRAGQVAAIEEQVRTSGLELERLHLGPGSAGDITLKLEVRGGGPAAVPTLAERLRDVPGVRHVTYGTRLLQAEENGAEEDNESQHGLA